MTIEMRRAEESRSDRYQTMAWLIPGLAPFMLASLDNLFVLLAYAACLPIAFWVFRTGVPGLLQYKVYLVAISFLAFGSRWAFGAFESSAAWVAIVTLGLGMPVILYATKAIRTEVAERRRREREN